MATGPLNTDPDSSVRPERDDLARRCAAAEEEVRRLRAELEEARARLADYESAAAEPDGSLSLFEGEPLGTDPLTGDGSDPRVLSGLLAATAVVAAMVAFLALLNGKLGTPFGLAMVAATIGLAWGAARTRALRVEVKVVDGIVYVEQGETTHRFDLRRPEIRVEVVGRPGDPGWVTRFHRRGLDPFVIDASMVDPYVFVHEIAEYRPGL